VERSAPVAVATLFDDVYAARPRHLVEQAEELARSERPAGRAV